MLRRLENDRAVIACFEATQNRDFASQEIEVQVSKASIASEHPGLLRNGVTFARFLMRLRQDNAYFPNAA